MGRHFLGRLLADAGFGDALRALCHHRLLPPQARVELVRGSIADRQAEVGFAFNPRFTGRGLATQAVAVVLGFAFVQLGVHRVVSCTDVRNERSWRLMERIGTRREAHFIHDCYVKGQWVDDYVYAMLDHEWQQRHTELLQAAAGG